MLSICTFFFMAGGGGLGCEGRERGEVGGSCLCLVVNTKLRHDMVAATLFLSVEKGGFARAYDL